jgi:hypothetical protein
LATRIQVGARPGDRVELVSAEGGDSELKPGDRGVVTHIGERAVHVDWDSGLTLPVNPFQARLRPVV